MNIFRIASISIILILQCSHCYSDTIPDNQPIYGHWTIEGSPYYIEGLAYVPTDSVLTIDPGVHVEFKSSTQDSAFIIPYLNIGWMKVFGTLIANGTVTDSIYFSRATEGWSGGIHLLANTGKCEFQFCNLSHFNNIDNENINGDHYYGGLTINDGVAFIKNSVLYGNYINIYSTNNANVEVQNTVLSNSGGGINTRNSYAYIHNCIIEHNTFYGIVFHQSEGSVINSAISNNDETGISSHTSAIYMDNNIIEGQFHGIKSYESEDTITHNLLRNNMWGGINITRCNPFVYKNIVYGSNSGIRFSGAPRIVNNTIINNTYFGIYCNYTGRPILINNIIYGNGDLVCFWSNDTIVMANCLAQMNTSTTGTIIDAGDNFIGIDPMFTDPDNHDFSLTVRSPCINSGTAFFEWNDVVYLDLEETQYYGIAPDMGAIETTIVGIKEPEKNESENFVNVFPNPARHNSVSISTGDVKNGHLNILDVNGKIIETRALSSQKSVINTENWQQGVYIAIIYKGGQFYGSTKIIIQ